MGFQIENNKLIKYIDDGETDDVIIPDGITSIGYNSFNSCNGIKSLTIPDSVTGIDKWAFYSCKGLKSVMIPKDRTINESAFSNCPLLSDGKGFSVIV